jgi:hypothetical protein
VEIKYAAAGFLLVRREVYETMTRELKLPLCNTQVTVHDCHTCLAG